MMIFGRQRLWLVQMDLNGLQLRVQLSSDSGSDNTDYELLVDLGYHDHVMWFVGWWKE